jgi:hypothetical protein
VGLKSAVSQIPPSARRRRCRISLQLHFCCIEFDTANSAATAAAAATQTAAASLKRLGNG